MFKVRVLVGAVGFAVVMGAFAQESPAPAAGDVADPQPFVTAPVGTRQPLALGSTAKNNSLTVGAALPSATSAEPLDDKGVPWVLTSDQHPVPLTLPSAAITSSLYLALPTVGEARLMPPGKAMDAAESARLDIGRYMNEVSGQTVQQRSRQLEVFMLWKDRLDKQKASLSGDAWQAYQFAFEARPMLVAYRDGLLAQKEQSYPQILDAIKRYIQEITPLVSAMPSYEAQVAWYNLLVVLKDGAEMLGRQIEQADQRTLAAVNGVLDSMPAPLRPAGAVPIDPTKTRVVAAAPATPAMTAVQIGKPDVAEPVPMQLKTESNWLAALVAVFLVLGGGVLWLKYGRRRKNTISV